MMPSYSPGSEKYRLSLIRAEKVLLPAFTGLLMAAEQMGREVLSLDETECVAKVAQSIFDRKSIKLGGLGHPASKEVGQELGNHYCRFKRLLMRDSLGGQVATIAGTFRNKTAELEQKLKAQAGLPEAQIKAVMQAFDHLFEPYRQYVIQQEEPATGVKIPKGSIISIALPSQRLNMDKLLEENFWQQQVLRSVPPVRQPAQADIKPGRLTAALLPVLRSVCPAVENALETVSLNEALNTARLWLQAQSRPMQNQTALNTRAMLEAVDGILTLYEQKKAEPFSEQAAADHKVQLSLHRLQVILDHTKRAGILKIVHQCYAEVNNNLDMSIDYHVKHHDRRGVGSDISQSSGRER